jgi:hypothetical protein
MARNRADDSQVFQLKVTLKGSKPPIWRRIRVRGSMTLPRLHDCLQTVMGWTDSHLHQFVLRGPGGQRIFYGQPDPDGNLEWGLSERRVRLDRLVAAPKDRFVYEYDFGDGWEHDILVEQVLPPDPEGKHPVCLAGKRACPPEDVGGIWGFAEFLEAMANPEHPEHEERLEWYGDDFDPDEFSVEEVNRQLRAT